MYWPRTSSCGPISGVDADADTAELGPAQEVLEWLTRDAAFENRDGLFGSSGRGLDQPGLIFGEHTTGRPQPGDDEGVRGGL